MDSSPLLPNGDRRQRQQWWFSHCRLSFRLKTTVWSELGGSVGDLGTYIPIVLALTLVNNLDLGTTLIFTAIYNIATGFLFGVPMPVQPMKSIAAIAISESDSHLTVPKIMAAGISTATILFVVGITGLTSWFYKYIPLPVVRGVQLSQGLSFAFTAITYIRYDQDFATGKSGDSRPWIGLDGLVVAISAVLFLILVTGSGDDEEDGENGATEPTTTVMAITSVSKKIPSALLVFALGLLLCFVRDPSILKDLTFGPSKVGIVKITWEDWKIGFIRAAIPQIPLSILNSVIAVCKLSSDLFPEKHVSAMAVSLKHGHGSFAAVSASDASPTRIHVRRAADSHRTRHVARPSSTPSQHARTRRWTRSWRRRSNRTGSSWRVVRDKEKEMTTIWAESWQDVLGGGKTRRGGGDGGGS